MEEYSTERRMRSHIIITMFVLWLVSGHYGSGFSITTIGSTQFVVPNWVAFLALGVGIVLLRRYRDQVLGPIEEWMWWVLIGEEEA